MLVWRVRRFFERIFWTKAEKEFDNIFHVSAYIQRAAKKEGYLDLDGMARMWKEREKERVAYNEEMKRQYDEICKHKITDKTPLEPLMWGIRTHQDLIRETVTITDENGVEHTVETIRHKPFEHIETDGGTEE